MAMMNSLTNQIDATFGLPPSNRYLAPQDTYVMGDTTNHFNLSNNVIGAINTGVVGTLNATLNDVAVNDPALAQDLKSVAEMISMSSNLKREQKEEAIEALTFLGEQSRIESQRRNKVMIKVAGQMIMNTLSLAADLITVAPLAVRLIEAIK